MAVIVPADISDVTNFVTALCVRQGMSADGALRAGQEAMAARLSQLRTAGSGLETWEFVWPEEGEVEERVMVTLAAPDRRAVDDFAAVKRVR